MSLISCPYCNENDFDLIGLKDHLQVWCAEFEKTMSPEESRAQFRVELSQATPTKETP